MKKCFMCRKELQDVVEIKFKADSLHVISIFLCTACAYRILSKYTKEEWRNASVIWHGVTWKIEYSPRTDEEIEQVMEYVHDRVLFPVEARV